MNRLLRVLAPLALAAVFATSVMSQEVPPPPPDLMALQGPDGAGPGAPGGHGPGGPGFRHMELLGFGGFHGGKLVTGAPFSATGTTTFTRVLGDGTKINNTSKVSLYRDSQGRFRKEGSVPAVGDASAGTHSFIVISDPVAAKGYLLNPDKKVAHVAPLPKRMFKGGKGAKGGNGAPD